MAAAFAGLSPDMFALYVPAKWSSNVHNLPRMRSKDALQALAASIEAQAGALLEGLGRASSDEVPNISNHKKVTAQWVYWSRDAAERQKLASFLEKMPLGDASIFTVAPYEKHASIALVLHEAALEFGVVVPGQALVDRRNAQAKLQQSWERQAALEALRALPPHSEWRLGTSEPQLVSGLDEAALTALAPRLGAEPGPLFIGVRVLPLDAAAKGARLADELAAALPLLGPVYRFLAWHRSNDAIEAVKQLQAEKAEQRRQASPFRRKDEVRVVGGMFRGQRGHVLACDDPRGHIKVQLGRMSVLIAREDLVAAAR